MIRPAMRSRFSSANSADGSRATARDPSVARPSSTVCLLCSEPASATLDLPHIWHQPAGTPSYTIAWCDSCLFGRLAPLPSLEDLDRFYGAEYFKRYAGQPRQVPKNTLVDRLRVRFAWKADRHPKTTAESIRTLLGPPPKSWCDIGCGNGYFLNDLRGLGYDLVGVETDAAGRARTSEHGIPAYAGYAESLPTEVTSRTFDLVTMFQVLEHCLSPLDAVKNAAGILAPNGRLLVEVPNHECVSARTLGTSWFHTDAGRHLSFFTGGSLETLMRRAGLRVVERRYSCYVEQFTNARRVAEQEVFECLHGDGAHASGGLRASAPLQWRLLRESIFSEPRYKYEVVGVIAERA